MVLEFILGQMVQNILAIGWIIKQMDLEKLNIKMEHLMKEILLMGKQMVQESFEVCKEQSIKVIGRMINSMEMD